LTSEKKIKILEQYTERLEEENADLKEENQRLKTQLEVNDVDSVMDLQKELRGLIQSVKEQKGKYEELNRDMAELKRGYMKDMKMKYRPIRKVGV
jgi:predicted RNase H-like nuclease (RuvC/YqgF family)